MPLPSSIISGPAFFLVRHEYIRAMKDVIAYSLSSGRLWSALTPSNVVNREIDEDLTKWNPFKDLKGQEIRSGAFIMQGHPGIGECLSTHCDFPVNVIYQGRRFGCFHCSFSGFWQASRRYFNTKAIFSMSLTPREFFWSESLSSRRRCSETSSPDLLGS